MKANCERAKGSEAQGLMSISVYFESRGVSICGDLKEFESTTTPLNSSDQDSRPLWLTDISPREVRSSIAVVNMSASFQSFVGCVREKISPLARWAMSGEV